MTFLTSLVAGTFFLLICHDSLEEEKLLIDSDIQEDKTMATSVRSLIALLVM